MQHRKTSIDDRLSPERVAEIRAVARAHFMEDGFVTAGMAEIAREAEISTATLYKMAPSKEDLFVQVVEEICAEQETLIRAIKRPEAGDACEQLKQLILLHSALMRENELHVLLRRVLAVIPRFPELGSHVHQKLFQPLYDNLKTHLDAMVADSLLSPHDTELGAQIIAGMMRETYQISYFFGGYAPSKEDTDANLEIIIQWYTERNKPS